MSILRFSLLALFIASVITAVAVGSTGYTGALTENGKYFVTFKSTRYEVSRDEYEATRSRDRTSGIAIIAMGFSLFAFIGLESLPLGGGRHITTRCSGPAPASRFLRPVRPPADPGY